MMNKRGILKKFDMVAFKNLKRLDRSVVRIINAGVKASVVLGLVSIFILIWYEISSVPFSFYIGISLFKASLFYIMAFIIGGIAFDKIKKDCA